MKAVDPLAPSGDAVVDYDRCQLALYAALLEAADAGLDWKEAAANVMGIDVDSVDAEACWRSHFDRARWIVEEGLGLAVDAFNMRCGRTA